MNNPQIITLPSKSLRKRSQKISFIGENAKKLSEEMIKATLSWEDSREHEIGVALAAVQVDRLQRLVVIRSDFNNKANRSFFTLLNPKIIKKEGEVVEDFEGCLSVANLYGKVSRHQKIKIKAMNLDGKEMRMSAEGFLARVIQHEIDHTNGIIFIDHIKDSPDSFYKLLDTGELEKLDYKKFIKKNTELWP